MTPDHGRPVLGDAPPSGKAIRKSDVMLSRSDKGLCLTVTCLRLADDDDLLCLWCRRQRTQVGREEW